MSALERPVFRAESHGRIDARAERVFVASGSPRT
jgi:hypothetical protein